ncbi:hypothetical protein GQ457_18G011080 [Hibiscus cannabinus]
MCKGYRYACKRIDTLLAFGDHWPFGASVSVQNIRCAALWPNSVICTIYLISCPKNFRFITSSKVIKSPSTYALKFNTDGAVNGSFGDAGIGGCLRNEKSKCLISFSKSIGVSDVISAEIAAISEACKLFRNSVWSNSYKLIIENDNKLVVEWIQQPHCCPTMFKSLITNCRNLCKGLDWRRASNSCRESSIFWRITWPRKSTRKVRGAAVLSSIGNKIMLIVSNAYAIQSLEGSSSLCLFVRFYNSNLGAYWEGLAFSSNV